jgi:hypothetical protein
MQSATYVDRQLGRFDTVRYTFTFAQLRVLLLLLLVVLVQLRQINTLVSARNVDDQ